MSPPTHDPLGHDHPHAPRPDGVGIPRSGAFDAPAFEKAVGDLLRACGIAPDNAHTGRTAQRVRELWQRRLLGGYELDPAEVLGDGFEDPRRDMVVIRGIAVHGVCPHHLVPFRGVAHVAYLPGGRLHGFGRIARLVDAIGHRFTYQEWMTRDIADALMAPRPGRRRGLRDRGRAAVPAARRGPARRRARGHAGLRWRVRTLGAGPQRIPARDRGSAGADGRHGPRARADR